MSVDRVMYSEENLNLSAIPQPLPRETSFEDSLGVMQVLVLDLDALGSDSCNFKLLQSEDPCMFVIWYPWRYEPAEAVRLHRELVSNGATLIERASQDQSMRECWEVRKAEVLELIAESDERAEARPNRRTAGAAV